MAHGVFIGRIDPVLQRPAHFVSLYLGAENDHIVDVGRLPEGNRLERYSGLYDHKYRKESGRHRNRRHLQPQRDPLLKARKKERGQRHEE